MKNALNLDIYKLPTLLADGSKRKEKKLEKSLAPYLEFIEMINNIPRAIQHFEDKINKFIKDFNQFTENVVKVVEFLGELGNNTQYVVENVLKNIQSHSYHQILIENNKEELKLFLEINSSLNSIQFKNELEIQNLGVVDEFEKAKEVLSDHLKQVDSKNIRKYIFDLMTVLSFVIALYTLNVQSSDVTNKEVIEKNKIQIEKLQSELTALLEEKFNEFSQKRFSITNVYLRMKPRKNSQRVGLVKKDQEVLVLEVHHKWLLIQYFDFETDEPKSGYVFKKYFRRIK